MFYYKYFFFNISGKQVTNMSIYLSMETKNIDFQHQLMELK